MTLGVFNRGAVPNDFTGDPFRTVLGKLNNGPGVISRTASAPGSPSDGDFYIVPVSATGDWAGQDNAVAYYNGTAWEFFSPVEGWEAWDRAADQKVIWNGSAWAVFSGSGGGSGIAVEKDGNEVATGVTRVDFTGAGVGVTDDGSGQVTVEVLGGGGGSGIGQEISNGSGTNVASFDVTWGPSLKSVEIEFLIRILEPSGVVRGVDVTTSSDGTNFDTGASDYRYQTEIDAAGGGSGNDGSIAASEFPVVQNVAGAPLNSFANTGYLRILFADDTTFYSWFEFKSSRAENNDLLAVFKGTAQRLSTGAIRGVRFTSRVGNIDYQYRARGYT